MFLKPLENFLNMCLVLQHVVGIDQDIVKVNNYADIKHVREDVIDKMLKRCWGICKSEGHDEPFKRSVAGVEGSFPFITFSNVDKVVGMLEIDLGVDLSLSGSVQ